MTHSAELSELSLLNSSGQERDFSQSFCVRGCSTKSHKGQRDKSFFLHVHSVFLWPELSSFKHSLACTLKEKKNPNAKYSPAHIVLLQRTDERKSKPHVTDVSHIAKCTAGRSHSERAVGEPLQYCCLNSFRFQAKMLFHTLGIQRTYDWFLFCC